MKNPEFLGSPETLSWLVTMPITRNRKEGWTGQGTVGEPAHGVLRPSRWPCLSWGLAAWSGGSGQEGQEAEVRTSLVEGLQAERKPGPVGRQCVSAHADPGARQPLAGRESALTSLLHPYFRPWKSADTAEATGLLPEGQIGVSSSLFSFKKIFLKRDWLPKQHGGGVLGVACVSHTATKLSTCGDRRYPKASMHFNHLRCH